MNIEDFISKDDWAERSESFIPNEVVLSNISKLNSKLRYVPNEFSDLYANIFIFGLARSGTTLASQLIADNTSLGYINNLIASFWENPQYGVYLSRHLSIEKNISYVSELGKTQMVGDISEFGYFWAPLLGHRTAAELGENDRLKINWPLLTNKVLSINHAFSNSCVYKNVLLGHYAHELNEAFKSPLFVYVKRRYRDTAYSILKAREKRYGSINHWLSTKPVEYKKLVNMNPHEQIVAQMYYLEKDIEMQTSDIDPDRILIVDYENICKNPDTFLVDLKIRLNKLGQTVSIKSTNKTFSTSSVKINNEDAYQLKSYINQYFA